MMKIDLHVHSKYSKRPSQWVLQKISCPESFTEPMLIYKYMDKNKSMLRKRNCKFLTDTCQYIIQLSFQKFKSFIC